MKGASQIPILFMIFYAQWQHVALAQNSNEKSKFRRLLRKNQFTAYHERTLQNNGDNSIQLFLYNADTNEKLVTIKNDVALDISRWGITDPQVLNIEVATTGSRTAGSVRFILDFGVLDRVDGGGQVFMCGNDGYDVFGCFDLKLGKHTLQVIPYSLSGGTGDELGNFIVNFELTKSEGIITPSDPSITPITNVDTSQVPPFPFRFDLYNAITDQKLTEMENAMVIVLDEYDMVDPTNLNIEAVVTGEQKPASVKFVLNSKQYTKIDSGGRFALFGNNGNDFLTYPELALGTHTLLVIAYDLPGASGNELGSSLITFEIVRSIGSSHESCSVPKLVGDWEKVVEYPLHLAESMGALIGDDFVIVSGFTEYWENVTKKVYALKVTDPNGHWREMDEVPTEQGFSHASYAVDGKIMYICGSYVGPSPGPDSDICLRYDHAASPTNQFYFMPSLPEGRGGGGLFHIKETNSLLYATGATRHDGEWIDHYNAWELNLNRLSAGWKSVQDIPYKANHISHVRATYQGKNRYFMLGGQLAWDEAEGNIADNFEWDVESRIWIRRADLPFARGHTSASTVAYGCGFLLAGGALNGHRKTGDISYYAIDTNAWTSIGSLPRDDINTPVCDIARFDDGNDWLYCITGPISLSFAWRIRIQS